MGPGLYEYISAGVILSHSPSLDYCATQFFCTRTLMHSIRQHTNYTGVSHASCGYTFRRVTMYFRALRQQRTDDPLPCVLTAYCLY